MCVTTGVSCMCSREREAWVGLELAADAYKPRRLVQGSTWPGWATAEEPQ